MGKNKSCDSKTRELILKLFDQKMSYSEIANVIKCSKTMVFNAIHHFRKHSTPKNVPRKRKPRKTTEKEDKMIVRESKKFPHKSARQVSVAVFGENGCGPSVDTVKRRLREAGLFGRVCRKTPLVSKRNRKRRMEFARKYRHWTLQDWKKVLFTDETKINRVWSDGRSYVRRPVRAEFNPRYTRPTLKHGGGNIMVWGGMSWRGVGPIAKIEGRMDRFQYTDILQSYLIPYADENLPVNWIFQQDNDPKHTAGHTKKWFTDNMVTVLDWPSCSPDLNPIENLWQVVKERVGGLKITNFTELYAEVQKAWISISKTVCEDLVASMPRRCAAVLLSKGYPTKY